MVLCDKCGTELHIGDFPFCGGDPVKHVPAVSGVIGDDIPGGIYIKHGLVNPDGSPRKFYSMTEIRRAANEAGLTQGGDTPKPYRVPWSGRRADLRED